MIARSFACVILAAGLSIGAAAGQTPAPQRPQPQNGQTTTQVTQSNRSQTTNQTTRTNRGQPPTSAPVTGEAPPPPPSAPPAPPSTPTPRRENQSTNVRIDVTITDQRPTVPALTKTVSVVTGDGLNGSVRSQTNYAYAGTGPGNAPFNVDVWPVILADGKVHIRLTVQYDVVPPPGPTQGEPAVLRLLGTTIRDGVALILESGKPMIAVQSTDPVSDRKVSVEVKATILR